MTSLTLPLYWREHYDKMAKIIQEEGIDQYAHRQRAIRSIIVFLRSCCNGIKTLPQSDDSETIEFLVRPKSQTVALTCRLNKSGLPIWRDSIQEDVLHLIEQGIVKQAGPIGPYDHRLLYGKFSVHLVVTNRDDIWC